MAALIKSAVCESMLRNDVYLVHIFMIINMHVWFTEAFIHWGQRGICKPSILRNIIIIIMGDLNGAAIYGDNFIREVNII